MVRNKAFDVLELARPHQYLKNLFIIMPLFFVGGITNLDALGAALLAFAAFSLSASSIYVLNDFLDIESDRVHPKKKHRPLAAGTVSRNQARILLGVLASSGLALMFVVSKQALLVLVVYMVMNVAYSIRLKHIPILDVVIISTGFVLRVFVGSFATDVPLSMWIVIMTFLLALFMALAKRRDDVLIFMDTGQKMRQVVDGYNLQFIDNSMMIMASVVIVAYLLYTTSVDVVHKMQSEYLYLTAFFVIIGVMRYLQRALVEHDSGSPTMIVLRDRFMQVTIIGWVLAFVWIIYL